jgi:hypothetical protein
VIEKVQVFLVCSSGQLNLTFTIFAGHSKEEFGEAEVDQKVSGSGKLSSSKIAGQDYCKSPDTKSSSVSFGLKSDMRSASFKQSS